MKARVFVRGFQPRTRYERILGDPLEATPYAGVTVVDVDLPSGSDPSWLRVGKPVCFSAQNGHRINGVIERIDWTGLFESDGVDSQT